ncbi:LysR family transcriptional regulator [Rhodococcus sp. NCIMB 12038]|uniref:helix-turn-helix domain-containing protein n=1 Tax=Rhodococcus sp. NCIMB 12038 TaxID=933800 RepID=UPI0015C60488
MLTGRGAWSRLERFDAIVRCGSLQAAADDLNLYASVLCTQLSRLEYEAGMQLWDRREKTSTVGGEQLLRQFRAAKSAEST